jgi:hypothetical protein
VKLRKNTGVKAFIVAASTGLFVGLLALIRANPRISVEASSEPTVTPQPTPNYDGFFRRDGRRDDDDGAVPQTQSQAPSTTTIRPHTRTRGS